MGCYGNEGDKAHDCVASGERWEDFAAAVGALAKLAGFDGVAFAAFQRTPDEVLHISATMTNAPVFCTHELASIRDIAGEEVTGIEIRAHSHDEDDEDEDTIGETQGEA
jgi:hypothetical protein